MVFAQSWGMGSRGPLWITTSYRKKCCALILWSVFSHKWIRQDPNVGRSHADMLYIYIYCVYASVYIYIYIYMCVYINCGMYIYIIRCVRIYIYDMYIYIYMHMYIYIYIHYVFIYTKHTMLAIIFAFKNIIMFQSSDLTFTHRCLTRYAVCSCVTIRYEFKVTKGA